MCNTCGCKNAEQFMTTAVKYKTPILIGIGINLVLPMLVKPFATSDEIKPPTGNAKDLTFKQQLVHMMVHHAQVPISSSIIVGTIVGLSIYIGNKL
ncbi:MAG: hypothetical protein CMB47_07060 [Euryarchaeota archaeon]|nr:hypothetical protein [Euryarchaeota archaeon]|tara:strand:- start:339 stop:626 length:288 start_codon:yes stop_codon:yes gene_type:complete